MICAKIYNLFIQLESSNYIVPKYFLPLILCYLEDIRFQAFIKDLTLATVTTNLNYLVNNI